MAASKDQPKQQYRVRKGFVVHLRRGSRTEVYESGEDIKLSQEEYDARRHQLEAVPEGGKKVGDQRNKVCHRTQSWRQTGRRV